MRSSTRPISEHDLPLSVNAHTDARRMRRRFNVMNAHTDARRRSRRCNGGRVLVLNNTPLLQTSRGGGDDSTSVECLFSIPPAEEEDEIERRSSACYQ